MGNVDCRNFLKGNPNRNGINYNFSLDTHHNLNINLNNINNPQEEKKVMNSPSPIILNNSNGFYNNSGFSQENVLSSKDINSISSPSFESEEFKKYSEENIGGIKVSRMNKVVNNDFEFNERIVYKEKRKNNLNDKENKKEFVNEKEKERINQNNKGKKKEIRRENKKENKTINEKEKEKDNEKDDDEDNNNQSINIRRQSTILNFEHRRMPIEIIDEKKISKIINSMINERKDIERNNNNDNNLKINNKNIYVNINTNQLQNNNIPNNIISNNYIPYNNVPYNNISNNMPNFINPNYIKSNNLNSNNIEQNIIKQNNNIQNYNYFIQNNFTNFNFPQNLITNNIIYTNPQQIAKIKRNPEKNKNIITKKKNRCVHWKNINIINIIPLEKRTKVYDNTILLNGNFHVFSRETPQNKKLETTLRFIILTRSELKIYRSIEAKLFQKNPLRRISLFNISKCDLFTNNNSEINNKNLEFYFNFFIEFITVNKMVNNEDTYIHNENNYKHNNITYKLIHENNINNPTKRRKKISYLNGNSDNCKYKNFQIKCSNNFDNNSETLVFSCEDEKLINEWITVINYFIN